MPEQIDLFPVDHPLESSKESRPLTEEAPSEPKEGDKRIDLMGMPQILQRSPFSGELVWMADDEALAAKKALNSNSEVEEEENPCESCNDAPGGCTQCGFGRNKKKV